ncbi:two-component regulator propeller domain-containing protein [Dyadobacter sp. CY323]|uniref:two-component regulator propeller domain-containing protein n=1 Tax=Dyadobacter sp. CY323 TaxID=2907302 RepID=UPI001F380B21|nr:two-component regulator propeller domain-containing protein [Dyadobacter sp. CY323]MCE6989671.1 hypothetical protein [Dyadobacter sp. CY323]
MKLHRLHTLRNSLLFLLICGASCMAQVKTKLVRTLRVTSGNIGCDLQDTDGNIWFSSGGEGVYRYDGKSFTNITTQDGLTDNHVSKIIQDKKGNILFGTKKGTC